MNLNVYFSKLHNEVTRGLAGGVFWAFVQPISGQDRGGRNVTTRLLNLQIN
jgi:hypothetical protein